MTRFIGCYQGTSYSFHKLFFGYFTQQTIYENGTYYHTECPKMGVYRDLKNCRKLPVWLNELLMIRILKKTHNAIVEMGV